MKKDILIEKVRGLNAFLVYEYNEIYKTEDWNVYLVNETDEDLEMLLIVSKGESESHHTTPMRKKLNSLPAQSFAKIEWMSPEVFVLDNEFQITFFSNNKIQEAKFLLKRNTASKEVLSPIQLLDKNGLALEQIL